MKKLTQDNFYIVAVPIIIFFVFISGTTFANAAQYYECQISVKKSLRDNTVCRNYISIVHRCQIYDKNYSGSGIPSFCTDFCVDRSNIPKDCANVIVQPSNNPEAHQGRAQTDEGKLFDRLKGIGNEINTEDGVDVKEVQYVVGRVATIIKDILEDKVMGVFRGIADKVGDIKDSIADKIPFVGDKKYGDGDKEPKWGTDIDGDGITDFDPNEDNPFDETSSFESIGFNEFKIQKWPDEDGIKTAKIVDMYGKERYTSDGKHFYDNAYDAAHSGSGFSNISNKIGDAWSSFTGIFSFRGKLSDKDKELQREIAREVLKDAKSQKEKDVEKAYEKLSAKFKAPKFGDIPAKAVIEIAKEANATDFAGGVLVYIEQRKEGDSPSTIRENSSEELSAGYGTFGRGVSLSTVNQYAEAVIYARYEEAYQRYLLAKEFGRKK